MPEYIGENTANTSYRTSEMDLALQCQVLGATTLSCSEYLQPYVNHGGGSVVVWDYIDGILNVEKYSIFSFTMQYHLEKICLVMLHFSVHQ